MSSVQVSPAIVACAFAAGGYNRDHCGAGDHDDCKYGGCVAVDAAKVKAAS
jgi:hypothetical protein